MALSFAVPAQILSFSIEPMALPIPDCFTRFLVTGRSLMLVNKWSKRSTPPDRKEEERILRKVQFSESSEVDTFSTHLLRRSIFGPSKF